VLLHRAKSAGRSGVLCSPPASQDLALIYNDPSFLGPIPDFTTQQLQAFLARDRSLIRLDADEVSDWNVPGARRERHVASRCVHVGEGRFGSIATFDRRSLFVGIAPNTDRQARPGCTPAPCQKLPLNQLLLRELSVNQQHCIGCPSGHIRTTRLGSNHLSAPPSPTTANGAQAEGC
jgi:hypothetical protein